MTNLSAEKSNGSAAATAGHDQIGFTEHRPWGSFTILDEGENYKVKRLEIHPGKRLSYQKHDRRAEHWMVVRGTARATLNGEERLVKLGETVDVDVRVAHRVENPGTEPLILIEIQRGSYLGEDDITRLQDDFGRIGG